MNHKAVIEKLQSQSPTGRKVSLLLAHVNEHGPQPESALTALVGGHRPLRLAVGMTYLVLTPDGRYSIAAQGCEVVLWLLGYGSLPEHLKLLEARAAFTKKLKRPNGHGH